MKNYKDDSIKTFDKMAVSYENHYYGSQSRIMYKKVALKIEQFKHEFILDLGCGKGLFLENLKEYKSKLYGADLSSEMIKYAQKKSGDYAELKVADSENLPWKDNSFDIITCILSFHHYPNPVKSINEMQRVLRKNGHIVIAEGWLPAPFRNLANLFLKTKFNKSGDVKVYSKQEWRNMLETAGFINIIIESTNRFYLIITAEIT